MSADAKSIWSARGTAQGLFAWILETPNVGCVRAVMLSALCAQRALVPAPELGPTILEGLASLPAHGMAVDQPCQDRLKDSSACRTPTKRGCHQGEDKRLLWNLMPLTLSSLLSHNSSTRLLYGPLSFVGKVLKGSGIVSVCFLEALLMF